MNDLDIDALPVTGTALAPTGADPFSSYGAKVGTTGQFLSFKNGEFLYGQNSEELKIGTKLIANMPGLRIGWRRWFAGQVTDDLTELLIDQRQPQRRDELGDIDKSVWERDGDGEPRDPWQLTNVLELTDGKETYIYSTGSKGGIGAIGRLCKEYGKEYRMRPGMLPIIELGRDFYTHAKFGKTYFPEFTIVGWADADAPSLDGADGLPAIERAPKQGRQRAENPTLAGPHPASPATHSTTKSRSEPAKSVPRF